MCVHLDGWTGHPTSNVDFFINKSSNLQIKGTTYILRLSYHYEKEYPSDKLALSPGTIDTACLEETLAFDMPSLLS